MIMLDSPILFPWSLFLSHVPSVSPALLFPICSWWRWRDSEIVATKIEILLTNETKKRWLRRHRLAESETQVAMRLAIHRHDTSSEWRLERLWLANIPPAGSLATRLQTGSCITIYQDCVFRSTHNRLESLYLHDEFQWPRFLVRMSTLRVDPPRRHELCNVFAMVSLWLRRVNASRGWEWFLYIPLRVPEPSR